MFWNKLEKPAAIIVLAIAVLLTNKGVWLCLFDINNPLSFCSYGYAGSELPLLFLACCLAMGILWRRGMLRYLVFNEWKTHKPLLFFIFFAVCSIFWTVHLTGTIYHVLTLIFSTLLAIFLGSYFSTGRWFTILLWFSTVIVISSFALLIFFPNAAIMAEPHLGSWRGIFWHKNFTGSFMALANMIFLNLVISSSRSQKGRIMAGVSLYIMSLILTIFSLSAAGLVILFVLSGFELILFLWSKVRKRLTAQHYYLIVGISIVVTLIFVVNKDILFSLINRSPNLTGRIPLWNYLIKSTVLQQPIIGQGFGAIWLVEDFRKAVTTSQGWLFQITNGHNGFMDTLLNLGLTGFFLLILIFISAFQKTAQYFIRESDPVNMLPFLVVLYVLLANLSISFIQEIESFHWMILISTLFLTSQVEKSLQSTT